LANDFAAAIVAALEAGGTAVQNVSVLPEESDAAAEKKLLATKTERGVLVTIRDWKTDTYVNTKLIYDVVLRVFDSTGKERAKTGATGEDNLGGSNFNPPAHARKAVPPAFREKLKTLFNNPKIVAILK
tara:strand:- start:61 stop:447 length:387 start_codon:yes stop_codon:yes gene_type:complete